MPDLTDFFSTVCPQSLSKAMERRKILNPHQGMTFLQLQQVFPRGREKSQKSEDRDADFQFFNLLRFDKNCGQTLEKNAGFAGFLSRVFHIFFFKIHGTKKN